MNTIIDKDDFVSEIIEQVRVEKIIKYEEGIYDAISKCFDRGEIDDDDIRLIGLLSRHIKELQSRKINVIAQNVPSVKA